MQQNENPKVETEKRTRRKRRHREARKWYVNLVIVAGLLIISLFIGLAIGYVGLGHGKWSEAFQFSTYKHIYDLVFKST